jgi:SAM-dependent methyltransferase
MATDPAPNLIALGAEQHYADPDLYEHEYRRRRDDVRFYAAFAREHVPQGEAVLDLGCGSGRVTRALLREGLHVVGIDRSDAMLERARQGIARLPIRCRDNAELVRADLRDFELGRSFPLVVSPFNTMEHLYSRVDLERCLAAVKRHLQPGGRFVFDVQLPDLKWLSKDSTKRWARTKFRHPVSRQWLEYSTNQDYDAVNQIAYVRLYYKPLEDGPLKQTQVVHLSQRKFFPAELRALLHYSGFEVLRHEADYEGDALDEFAESQVLVCRRRTG